MPNLKKYSKFGDHFINVTNEPELVPTSLHGTSFHHVYANVDPQRLITCIGEGSVSDEYKVSQEWEFVTLNEEGDPNQMFRLYDWKETNLYASDNPSPERFWQSPWVELHIGHKVEHTDMAIKLKQALELVAGADIPNNVWTGERISKLNVDELYEISLGNGKLKPFGPQWQR